MRAVLLARIPQNNMMRKKLFRRMAREMGYTFRRPLPTCCSAAIRNTFPSETGIYLGYRAAAV